MKQPSYKIYPSLLDKFDKYLRADEEVENFWNIDNETVSIRPRACFSPSYNKVKSQTKHVWLLTLL